MGPLFPIFLLHRAIDKKVIQLSIPYSQKAGNKTISQILLDPFKRKTIIVKLIDKGYR